MGHYRPGTNAIGYYQKRKAEGTLPKAEKPVKKAKATSKPIPGYTGPGMVGAEATKSKNRRFTKASR